MTLEIAHHRIFTSMPRRLLLDDTGLTADEYFRFLDGCVRKTNDPIPPMPARRSERRHRGPARFKQNDVTKAAKGMVKAGLKVERAEIDQTGKIVVKCESDRQPSPGDDLDNWLTRQKR
jgi:hypothetical protein